MRNTLMKEAMISPNMKRKIISKFRTKKFPAAKINPVKKVSTKNKANWKNVVMDEKTIPPIKSIGDNAKRGTALAYKGAKGIIDGVSNVSRRIGSNKKVKKAVKGTIPSIKGAIKGTMRGLGSATKNISRAHDKARLDSKFKNLAKDTKSGLSQQFKKMEESTLKTTRNFSGLKEKSKGMRKNMGKLDRREKLLALGAGGVTGGATATATSYDTDNE